MADPRFGQHGNNQQPGQFYTSGQPQNNYHRAAPAQQQQPVAQHQYQTPAPPPPGNPYAHPNMGQPQFQATTPMVGTGFLQPGQSAPADPIQWAGASGGSNMQDSSVSGNMSSNPTMQSTRAPGEEPPLLEELGIRPDHIIKKTLAVLLPIRDISELAHDSDMAGPIAICLALGTLLMASGELHFSVIYTFFLFGSFAIYVVLNLMAQHESIDVLRVFSVLGYCLLPIVVLSAISVFFDLRLWWGSILALTCILWCTLTSTRFFEAGLQCREQRYLIAYPLFLLYSCFALITVF